MDLDCLTLGKRAHGHQAQIMAIGQTDDLVSPSPRQGRKLLQRERQQPAVARYGGEIPLLLRNTRCGQYFAALGNAQDRFAGLGTGVHVSQRHDKAVSRRGRQNPAILGRTNQQRPES